MKKSLFALLLIIAVVTFYPGQVFAAWAATDTFEGYANGNDMNTLNGGSGFSGAWSGTAGKYFISNTTAFNGSTLSAKGSNANANMSRTLASDSTSGVIYFATNVTSPGTNQDSALIFAKADTTRLFRIRAASTGGGSLNYTVYDGASTFTNIVTGASANTWYLWEITYDGSTSPGTYSIRYNTSGSASGWSATSGPYNYEGSATGAINNIILNQSTPITEYWDYISPTNPYAAVSTPVSIVGIVYAVWW